MRSVCVFCGSSTGSRPEFGEAAVALGQEIARRGLRLVYGGASVGLMGMVAEAAMGAGSEVVGVIPDHMLTKEVAHTGLSELRVTGTMHARKAAMADLADGFIALPGGFGTLEEFAEILTWSQLGLHAKPCGLLDVAGFYRTLLEFFDHAVTEGFVKPKHRQLVLADTDPSALLLRMEAWRPPQLKKWIDASDR